LGIFVKTDSNIISDNKISNDGAGSFIGISILGNFNLISANQINNGPGENFGVEISGNNNYLSGNIYSGKDFYSVRDLGERNTVQQKDLFQVEQFDTSSLATAFSVSQWGSGNILSLFDATSEVLTITDGGNIVVGTSVPPYWAKMTLCYTSNCVLPSAQTTTLVLGSVDDSINSPSIRARGTIIGSLSDIGEYVLVDGDANNYKPGDLLEASLNSAGVFVKSSKSYSKTLVGAVVGASAFIAGGANPSLIWDNGVLKNGVILSLSGQVQVKVSTDNGQILVGDFLTSSDIPGVAMKATKPGRVVGIALENYGDLGIGKILMFMDPHWQGGE